MPCDEPISMRAVEQHASASGIQRVTLGANGRVVGIGAPNGASPAQRRALAARAGGCIIPVCDTPTWATDVHQVLPWRNGGATHADNSARR
ncbi:HNH endonuclease signature motif containing protein [Agromyces sp. CCNWLW203]|uniref:HNH endonuclease signature motif containing protein n=1 Tax=Agromyces sp. CCNWLW203 TaxID=3112842 RepID=UPI002F964F89